MFSRMFHRQDKPLAREDVISLLQKKGSSEKLDLSGRNLEGIDLSDLDLRGARLNRTNLSGATLSYANLSGTTLRGANLSSADLEGVLVTEAQLQGALSLEGATMPDGTTRKLLTREDFPSLPFTVEQAINDLVTLYDSSPNGLGFVLSQEQYNLSLKRVRDIGWKLANQGGFQLMLQAHAEFAQRRPRAARNLEMCWDGIGGWMG